MKKIASWIVAIVEAAIVAWGMIWSFYTYDWRAPCVVFAASLLGVSILYALQATCEEDEDKPETEIRVCVECGERFELPKTDDDFVICPYCGNALVKEHGNEQEVEL